MTVRDGPEGRSRDALRGRDAAPDDPAALLRATLEQRRAGTSPGIDDRVAELRARYEFASPFAREGIAEEAGAYLRSLDLLPGFWGPIVRDMAMVDEYAANVANPFMNRYIGKLLFLKLRKSERGEWIDTEDAG